MHKMKKKYRFINNYCPSCNEEINPYSYHIIDNKRYCIGCEKKKC